MGDGIDIKGIGLAAKDILLGIAGAAAGSTGGPAGAESVNRIGVGLDKALAMGGISAEPPRTRAENFDRGGTPGPAKPAQPPPPPVAPPPAVALGEPEPLSKGGEDEGPLSGDMRLTVDHLRGLGWKRADIQKILAGPEYTALAALTGRQVGGRRIVGAKGRRVAQADGSVVPAASGQRVRLAEGEPVPVAFGRKVTDDGSA